MQLQLVQIQISLYLQVCIGKGNMHGKNSHIDLNFIYCHKGICFRIIWIKDSSHFHILKISVSFKNVEKKNLKQSRDVHCNDILKQIRMFSFSPAYPISLQTDPEIRENTLMPFQVYLVLLHPPPFLCEIPVCYHFYFHIVTWS